MERRYHYEVIAEYPNGGKDVVKVYDEPEPQRKLCAEANYQKGECFRAGDCVYTALVNIARGEELIPGQNIK